MWVESVGCLARTRQIGSDSGLWLRLCSAPSPSHKTSGSIPSGHTLQMPTTEKRYLNWYGDTLSKFCSFSRLKREVWLWCWLGWEQDTGWWLHRPGPTFKAASWPSLVGGPGPAPLSQLWQSWSVLHGVCTFTPKILCSCESHTSKIDTRKFTLNRYVTTLIFFDFDWLQIEKVLFAVV